jgi:hypothetical protein
MAAIHRVFDEQSVLPFELICRLPILGWREIITVSDPVDFANYVTSVVRMEPIQACREWVEQVVRFVLSEHAPQDWNQSFVISRCTALFTTNPDPRSGYNPQLVLSIGVRMSEDTTHHLSVTLLPLPERYFFSYKEDHRAWRDAMMQHRWMWELWAMLPLELFGLPDNVDVAVFEDPRNRQRLRNAGEKSSLGITMRKEDNMYFFDREYGSWFCSGTPELCSHVRPVG